MAKRQNVFDRVKDCAWLSRTGQWNCANCCGHCHSEKGRAGRAHMLRLGYSGAWPVSACCKALAELERRASLPVER